MPSFSHYSNTVTEGCGYVAVLFELYNEDSVPTVGKYTPRPPGHPNG